MNKFNLTFWGEILPGKDPQQVKLHFAKLFGIDDPERLDHFFSGETITLRRNLDRKVAGEYFHKLHKLGVTAELVKVELDSLNRRTQEQKKKADEQARTQQQQQQRLQDQKEVEERERELEEKAIERGAKALSGAANLKTTEAKVKSKLELPRKSTAYHSGTGKHQAGEPNLLSTKSLSQSRSSERKARHCPGKNP